MSSNTSTPVLFQPIKVGRMMLAHRIALAPLTRLRNTAEHVATDMMVEHYAQRATTGTFHISETVLVHPQVGNYPHAPLIHTAEQVQAWKKVVDAVHERSAYIFLQLIALGRGADPIQHLTSGEPYVSASAIPLSDRPPSDPVPRALTKGEIREYVTWYGDAAARAVHEAGFDGVEVHGANGWLVDQFLQDTSNKRTDEYGGSIEGRCRFALEVVSKIARRVGEDRTALRLSPFSTFQDMGMADPRPTFAHLVTRLRDAHPNLAYLHFIEPRVHCDDEVAEAGDAVIQLGAGNDFARQIWAPRPFISAGGYDGKSARYVAERYGDIIAFGRYFTSNPDLVRRIKEELAFNKYDRPTFYTYMSPKGYNDWPLAPEGKEGVSAA